jgi:hypothetical protein
MFTTRPLCLAAALLLAPLPALAQDAPEGGSSPRDVHERYVQSVQDKDFAAFYLCVDPDNRIKFLASMWAVGYMSTMNQETQQVDPELAASYEAVLDEFPDAPNLHGEVDVMQVFGLMQDADQAEEMFSPIPEEDRARFLQAVLDWTMANNEDMRREIEEDEPEELTGDPEIDGEWARGEISEDGREVWFRQVDGRWYLAMEGPEGR